MILILSETEDQSTNLVIDWFAYYKIPFLRINEDSENDLLFFNLSNFKINNTKEGEIENKNIKGCWFRRGHIFSNKFYFSEEFVMDGFKDKINDHFFREYRSSVYSIYYYLESQKKCLGTIQYNLNKLNTLMIAQKNGLNIPDTIITNNKIELLQFFKKHKQLITKGIQETIRITVKEQLSFYSTTEQVHKKDIDESSEFFFPSLFQKMLDKKYELRIFYLDGECYSMAIFSQTDEKTKIDFRNYNWQKPNRNVPYNLPKDIKEKITLVMKQVGLNTGSIDIVVTKDNKYYFLEINPVGQFGMVSYPCNYYLESKIAEYFKYNENS